MKQPRDNLIEQLVAEASGGTRRFYPRRLMWVWGVASALFILGVITLLQPFRQEWDNQLFTSLRFAAEMFFGAATIVWLIVLTFRSAVPASNIKLPALLAALSCAFWIGAILLSFYDPTYSSTMAGKRDHCVFEIFFLSLPPAVIGGVWLTRGFVLNGWLSGLTLGLAAGMIPAVLMQLACMYSPGHALLDHLPPVILLGLLSSGVGGWLQRRQ